MTVLGSLRCSVCGQLMPDEIVTVLVHYQKKHPNPTRHVDARAAAAARIDRWKAADR